MKRLDNFWLYVNKTGPTQPHMKTRCWEWTKGLSTSGYGRCWFNGTAHWAHRVSWFLTYGKWPTPCGLHHCDNRACVRPLHLFEGTKTANNIDKMNKGRWKGGSPAGEASGKNRLTKKHVTEIRSKYKTGRYSQVQLSVHYNVSPACISNIIVKRTWR